MGRYGGTFDEEIRVLHVDDDEPFLELSAQFLERADERIAVETETNPRQVLDRLTEETIHCVISDYQMPRLNGVEVLKAIRGEYTELPVIIYTGRREDLDVSSAISQEVTDILTKERGTEQYELLAHRVIRAVKCSCVRANPEPAGQDDIEDTDPGGSQS